MHGYVTDPALCLPVCIIIYNSLIGVRDTKYVEDTGVDKLILEIIKNHIGDPKICGIGALALSSLCFTSSKKKSHCFVQTTMKKYALKLFADDTSVTLGKMGAIELLDKVLEVYKKEKYVCERVPYAISFLNSTRK